MILEKKRLKISNKWKSQLFLLYLLVSIAFTKLFCFLIISLNIYSVIDNAILIKDKIIIILRYIWFIDNIEPIFKDSLYLE